MMTASNLNTEKLHNRKLNSNKADVNIPFIQGTLSDANVYLPGTYWNSNGNIRNCPIKNGLLLSYKFELIGFQFFIGYQNSGLYYRDITNNAVNPWVKVS